MYDITAFAEVLIKERKRQNLTQGQLAEKAAVTPQTISSYEKGAKFPTLENAVSIANALDVSLEFLCGSDAKPVPAPISTVADLANTVLNMLQFGATVTTEEFEEMEQADGDNYPEEYPTQRTRVCITFSDKVQPKLVEFIKNGDTIADLFNRGVLNESMYRSWMTGALNELEKIPVKRCFVRSVASDPEKGAIENA